MKKRILTSLLLCGMLLGITGCGGAVSVNVNNSENLSGNTFGTYSLIEIGNNLYYDSTTRIVYFWNGFIGIADCATTPSPYYAPNGLPYRYDPTTNTFEEIE